MTKQHGIGVLVCAVLGAAAVQIFAPASGVIAIVAGFFLVIGGTILTVIMSHSSQVVLKLWVFLSEYRRQPADNGSDEESLNRFFQAANLFRRGNIRPAEAVAQQIAEPFLRRGTQLVLDRFPREQINLALQRQIAEERDQLRQPVDMLRAMSNYAPAFGMLGTLLGLVQMLFGLGAGNLSSIGSAMGFAMLTTVYGLVLANLLFKPLASQLEQRGRRLIGRRMAHLQAVIMLCDRQHAELIREMMDEINSIHDMQQMTLQLQLARTQVR